ncbi:hypothetical protein RJ639_017657, partial [Escallonia herrerae]
HGSQHMLELLHKVDKFSPDRPGMHFGATDSTQSSEMPQAESPGASIALSNNNSSSPSFGLRFNNSRTETVSGNSQCFDHRGGQPRSEKSVENFSSEVLHTVSQAGKLSHEQEYRTQLSDNRTMPISARDLEAFGRSLKPSQPPQNYSPLQQMHDLKTDPNMRAATRYNSIGSDLNVQRVAAISGQLSLYGQGARNMVKSGMNTMSQTSADKKVLSYSSEVRGDQSAKASPRHILQGTPQEMVQYGQNDCGNPSISTTLSSRTERSQVGMQMAPSWFQHHGMLRNGQMLPMYDARAALQQSLGVTRVNSAAAIQDSVWPTTATTLLAVKHLSPPYSLPKDVTNQHLAVLRPKKRKVAAPELLPWYKEVTEGSQRPQNISMAELEWADAANRLIEKVEDVAEMIEDMLPLLRPKKRLILTTQLMQQVLRPAPATFLAGGASSNCESVAYISARLALGDACSLTCNYHTRDISDMSSKKSEISVKIDDQDFSKSVDNFVNQAKRLEGDLLRLDKRASILDIRVESQELEKFSVINRFAKFHSRGQVGAAETSLSSGTSNVMKTLVQRYVTAIPMPRTVPEGAHCLSL